MHGLLAKPPRQFARFDELGLEPRRLRRVLDARNRVGGGISATSFELAGAKNIPYGVEAWLVKRGSTMSFH